MKPIVSPIHIADIAGEKLRFFKSPSDAPDLPWHAVDDLYRCMKLPRDVRRALLRSTQAFPESGPDMVVTVATLAGPVVIASHPAAQGLIGAVVEDMMIVPETFRAKYYEAGTAALRAMTAAMSTMDGVSFAIQAAQNSLGICS